jgi:uncharacterized membrane protein YphA (DoxX/SURF4 family)
MRYFFSRVFGIICLRVWFSLVMIYNGRYIFQYSADSFWYHYFREVIHFPFPDLSFYLAKGSEFFGGLLLLTGRFNKAAGSLLAVVMLVATVFANISSIYGGFGSITFSYFLLALFFIFCAQDPSMPGSENNLFARMLILIRWWLASLLVVDAIGTFFSNGQTLLFNSFFGRGFFHAHAWVGGIVEVLLAISLFIRFIKIRATLLTCIVALIAVIVELIQKQDTGGYVFLITVIVFWFSLLLACYNKSRARPTNG